MSAAALPTPGPRRRRRRRLAGALAAAVVLTGCTGSGEEPRLGGPSTASDATSRPAVGPGEAHLDLSRLPVPRTRVCDVLAEDDVEQALGGPVTGTAHYDNGDEFEVTPGRVDIAHEWGCLYTGSDGTQARAWVFARPVPQAEAASLVRRARRGRDCAFPESVVFGAPSLTSVCEVPGPHDRERPAFRARLEGLFGDTWVGCEVTEPLAALSTTTTRADVVQRAEQWCTEVVTAASAPD